MIRTRAERQLFSNYYSSSTKPPGHVLLLPLTEGGFEWGSPGPTRESILFKNYCGSCVIVGCFFFVRERLWGLMVCRGASDWCEGMRWTSRDHLLMVSLGGTFRRAGPEVHWTTAPRAWSHHLRE